MRAGRTSASRGIWRGGDQIYDDPKGALELLEDIWVEMPTLVDGGHYKIVDEVVRLRKELVEAQLEIATLVRKTGG